MDLSIFCDILSTWGHILGHFTLKIVELLYNLPLYGYLLPPTLQPHISACGVDKKQSKMAGNSASCVS